MVWDVLVVLYRLLVRDILKKLLRKLHLIVLFGIFLNELGYCCCCCCTDNDKNWIGIILYMSGNERGMEYLWIGRAIGMVQSMRFSIWFREVLKRSLYVLPFLAGPIFLILTTMHVFVYIGMALWEGAIDVEEQASNEDIQYLYYLNNFNSYGQGCITVFNVLVVNDWHEIAT